MQNAAPPLISVPLTAFLGLFTEASPDALPEGVSPLNWDCDFDIGLVTMRPCLQSAFSFGGSSTGPNNCTTGTTSNLGNAPWNNPANITTGTSYATCIPGAGQNTPFVTAGTGQNGETFFNTWSNPTYVTQSVNYASFTLAHAGSSCTLECYGFNFGSLVSSPIVGVQVSFSAYVVAPPSYFGSIQAQLIVNGSAVGQVKAISPNSSTPTTYGLGGTSDNWGTMASSTDTIGVQLTAVIAATGGTVTFYANNVQMSLSYASGNSNPLIAQAFAFSLPALALNGIQIGVTGHYTGSVTFTAQLRQNGNPVGTIKPFSLNLTSDVRTVVGSLMDAWGTMLTATDLNNTAFGVQIIATASDATSQAFITLVDCTVSQVTGTQNFDWFKTFEQTNGQISTLALDSNGTIWNENVLSSPGQLTSIFTEIQPGTFAKSVTFDDVEYICFSNLKNGTDVPMQWTGSYFDRISQVGPGAPPAVSFTSTSYTIEASALGLTQPAAVVNTSGGVPIRALLWSTGPSVKNKAGNVITIEYTLATSAPDPNIQPGNVVYLQAFASVAGVSPNGSYVVISVQTTDTGNSPRNSFSVVAPSTQLAYVTPPTSASYQMSIATVTTTTPVPLLVPGMQAVIAGASGSTWDGTYTITAELNGAQLSIIDTSLTSDVATYQYSLVSGVGPAWTASTVYATGSVIVDSAGFMQKATTGGTSGTVFPTFNETPTGTTTDNSVTWTNEGVSNLQVTVTGTVNGGGIFNVTNAIITSAISGSFTISLISPNVASAGEQGSAIINGSEFQFDPGLLVVGTGTSPILGNSGGGTLTVAGNIGAGTRQAVCMFLTRNGYLTAASTPVTFTTTGGAQTLVCTHIPIGPPNVIARWIAFTAAGPNGIAGPNFYVIPEPVTVVDNGQNVTYSATVVNDNVTTNASFTFTDYVLVAADEIDIQGNNLFEQTELGSCTGNIAFANRMFYWGVQNKVPNFINMSFDGGYLPNTTSLSPLGWTVDPVSGFGGSLILSPIFGNAYQIYNQTGSVQNTIGYISQSAYEDYYKIPIININTPYSIRVEVAVPNPSAGGNLVFSLYSPSFNRIYGQFIVPFATASSNMAPYTGTLLTTPLQTVPADLVFRIYATNIASGVIANIDRVEIFPTAQPNLSTDVIGSYEGNFEAFDLEQGPIDASIYNQQSVTTCFTLFNSLYIVKTGSFVSTSDNSTTEPWQWTLNEVSASVGTPSINGVDYSNNLSEGGESYALIAGRAGLYIFQGGEPICLSGDIRTLWNAINWQYGYTLWVRNDIIRRRILVGVPLPTPNAWLPNAPANPNPTTPNVILAMSYKQVNTVSELIERATVRASSFTGKLIATDISRKWSIWQIQSPYGDFIERKNLSTPLFLGNSAGTGKVYQLTEGATDDDGAPVNQFYCTYGFVKPDTEQGLQIGSVRHTYEYMTYLASGSGNMEITVCPDVLASPYTDTLIPIALSANPLWDTECPLNEVGRRLFVQFSTNAVGSYFSLSSMVMMLKQDTFSAVRGTN